MCDLKLSAFQVKPFAETAPTTFRADGKLPVCASNSDVDGSPVKLLFMFSLQKQTTAPRSAS